MSLANSVVILLQLSVVLIVFSVGLKGTWQDATSLFRRPAMLARSFLSMNVIMPVLAALTAALFHLNAEVKIALILLAVSPMPPLLPRKAVKAGAKGSYVHGLLTAMSLLSIVVVPIAIRILGKMFGHDVHIGPTTVAIVVGKTILLPLGVGILLHARAPEFANRASLTAGRIGNVLLLVMIVPLLIFSGRMVIGVAENGAVLALAAFCVVGAIVGHWLGGPDPSERSILALATASRHPGLVLAIASANFPEHKKLVAAVVVLYLLVNAAILLPYNAWRKRHLSPASETPGRQQKAA
jgi:BASS family bile acid:Na+ symporter